MSPCGGRYSIRTRKGRQAPEGARRRLAAVLRELMRAVDRIRFVSGGAAALVLNFLKLRINHIFLRFGSATRARSACPGLTTGCTTARSTLTGRLAGGMGPLRDAGRGLSQSLGLLFN